MCNFEVAATCQETGPGQETDTRRLGIGIEAEVVIETTAETEIQTEVETDTQAVPGTSMTGMGIALTSISKLCYPVACCPLQLQRILIR